jgi:hypothetical protein
MRSLALAAWLIATAAARILAAWTVLLARRMKQLGITQATCSFWNLDPARLRLWPGLNCKPLLPLQPATGWIAVSPTNWRLSQYGLEYQLPGARLWFEDWKPVERLGGLLLYHKPTPTRPRAHHRRGEKIEDSGQKPTVAAPSTSGSWHLTSVF